MPVDYTLSRPVGSTELRVTRLGLGTGPIGGWPTAVSSTQAKATIERAWDIGVRYFDTAPFYGHGLSEQHVGGVLPERPRDAFALSTKVGRVLNPGVPEDSLFVGVPDLVPVFDFSREGTLRSLRESRARLRLENPDIVFMHDPDDHHAEALAGAFEVLAELRADGVISAIGAGMNLTKPLTEFILERDFDCMLVAGRYTLLEQTALDELFPAALARNVSIVAAGVLNSGLLHEPGPDSTYDYGPAPTELIHQAMVLEAACAEFDVPLRAAALQFPFSHPAVTCIVVGARTAEEVDDTARMLELAIPVELWDHLKEQSLIREDAPTPAS